MAESIAVARLDDDLDLPMPKPGANNDLPAPKGFFDDLPQPASGGKTQGDDRPARAQGILRRSPAARAEPAARGRPGCRAEGILRRSPAARARTGARGTTRGRAEGILRRSPAAREGRRARPGRRAEGILRRSPAAREPGAANRGRRAEGHSSTICRSRRRAPHRRAGLFDDLPQPTRPRPTAICRSAVSISNAEPLGVTDLARWLDRSAVAHRISISGFRSAKTSAFSGSRSRRADDAERRSARSPTSPHRRSRSRRPAKGGAPATPIPINVPKDRGRRRSQARSRRGSARWPGASRSGREGGGREGRRRRSKTPEELAARCARRRSEAHADRARRRARPRRARRAAASTSTSATPRSRHARDEIASEHRRRAASARRGDADALAERARAGRSRRSSSTRRTRIALGLAAEASIAGALDTGINGHARIAQGRKFLQDGLGAGKITPELERAQALSYIASESARQSDSSSEDARSAGRPETAGCSSISAGRELANGDADEALKAFDQAVAKTHGDEDAALYGQGRAKLMLGRRRRRADRFATILETSKDHIVRAGAARRDAAAVASPRSARPSSRRSSSARTSTKKRRSALRHAGVRRCSAMSRARTGRLDIAREHYRKALALTATRRRPRSSGSRASRCATASCQLAADARAEGARRERERSARAARQRRADGHAGQAARRREAIVETLAARKPPLPPLRAGAADVVKGKLLEAQGKPDEAVDAYAEARQARRRCSI